MCIRDRLLLQCVQRFRALQYEQRVFTQKIIRYIHDADVYKRQLYMRYMAALKDEAFVQKQLERSIRLFEDSTHSTDTETREAAFYTLSGLYLSLIHI